MLLFEIKVTSKSGNNVTTYFETSQGSKYILTDKNESKRIKSAHANTGGEDAGLKKWWANCIFVPKKNEYEANSPQFLMNSLNGIKDIFISIKGDKFAFYKKIDNKFEVYTWDDAYPKSKKGKIPLVFEFTKTPTKDYYVVEYEFDNTSHALRNYHFGSQVTIIKPIDQVPEAELLRFKD